MADSIFVRVQRVVSGGLESAVDAAEQLSSTSMMRQALRDMDRAISRTRDETDAALARRLQTEHQLERSRRQIATHQEQARFAIQHEREDLAAAAVARQIDLERQIETLREARGEATAAEKKLEAEVAELRLRKRQMEEQFDAFQAAQRAAQQEETAAGGPGLGARRKAERAEEAFDRAMAAAGGLCGERVKPEAAGRVAEIETLQKEAAIAERLAALRAAATAPASAAKPARKRAR